mgnify:CR=1 FL=1
MHDDERYDGREGAPAVEEFQRLRALAGMSEHPREGVERGLPNSSYAVRAVDRFVDEDAPPSASVNLLADVDGFYERAGYAETRPASKGISRRVV